jgi:hypothetical protein
MKILILILITALLFGQKVYSSTSNQLELSSLQKGIFIVKFENYKSIKIIN